MIRKRWRCGKVVCATVILSLLGGPIPCSIAGKSRNNMPLAGSRQGQSVGFVDVDGDGIDDKIVGAPYASIASRQGAVLVYKGTGDGGFSRTPTAILTGDDNYGISFVNLGDVNSDGQEDFAVGALNGGGDLSGSVTIYRGGQSWSAGKGKGKVIAQLAGEDPLDKFGIFATAGDLNNDGLQDLIVGAPYHTEDPALYQAGAVYVLFAPDFTEQASLYATAQNKGLGWSAAAGDINGDALADLCISASGKVLCYYGGPDFTPETNAPDVTINSASKGFGRAVAMADVSGDGNDDLAIGAPNAVINGARDTGSLYVVQGGPGLETVNADEPSPQLLARINGTALFDRFGATVAAVDDRERGQEATALLVGAPMSDLDPINHLSGKVYLFRGEDIRATTTLADAAVFSGFTRDQGYGTSLAVDDRARMLCGAPRTNGDTGWVSVVDLASGRLVP
jgi:hypothetical protein